MSRDPNNLFDDVYDHTLLTVNSYNENLKNYKSQLKYLIGAVVVLQGYTAYQGTPIHFITLFCILFAAFYNGYVSPWGSKTSTYILRNPVQSAFFASLHQLEPLNIELIRNPEDVLWKKVIENLSNRTSRDDDFFDECVLYALDQLIIASIQIPVKDTKSTKNQ